MELLSPAVIIEAVKSRESRGKTHISKLNACEWKHMIFAECFFRFRGIKNTSSRWKIADAFSSGLLYALSPQAAVLAEQYAREMEIPACDARWYRSDWITVHRNNSSKGQRVKVVSNATGEKVVVDGFGENNGTVLTPGAGKQRKEPTDSTSAIFNKTARDYVASEVKASGKNAPTLGTLTSGVYKFAKEELENTVVELSLPGKNGAEERTVLADFDSESVEHLIRRIRYLDSSSKDKSHAYQEKMFLMHTVVEILDSLPQLLNESSYIGQFPPNSKGAHPGCVFETFKSTLKYPQLAQGDSTPCRWDPSFNTEGLTAKQHLTGHCSPLLVTDYALLIVKLFSHSSRCSEQPRAGSNDPHSFAGSSG